MNGDIAGCSVPKRMEAPRSSYYFGPPPPDAAFGTEPIGQLGAHLPREVVRIERDYSGGEVVQFTPAYPLEFEGRVSVFHLYACHLRTCLREHMRGPPSKSALRLSVTRWASACMRWYSASCAAHVLLFGCEELYTVVASFMSSAREPGSMPAPLPSPLPPPPRPG